MAKPPKASRSREIKIQSLPARWVSRWTAHNTLALLTNEELGIRVCNITLGILLCGYYLMHNDWQQQLWFVLACPIAFAFAPWQNIWPNFLQDKFIRCGAHFLAWMTITSFLGLSIETHQQASVVAYWLYGTTLLIAFILLCWHAAQDLKTLHQLGWWIGMTASFAALMSILVFYFILPGHVIGERLRNWFVYGGLNPVATGLTFGFASMWLTCIRNTLQKRADKTAATVAIIILMIAVFFSRSRGAVLALVAGHTALVLAKGGLRTNRTPLAIFIAIALIFQGTGPLISLLSSKQSASRKPMISSTAASSTSDVIINPEIQLPKLYSNPALELINRGDNGRFQLYQSAISSLQGPRLWLMGIGQWCTEHLWKPCIAWNPEHMHSIFLSTLVHGGIVGLALFLMVYSLGVWRALKLAKAGHSTWLVLLSFGTAGLLFDGQTMTTFASIPRMEVLLVTFPMIVSAAAYHHLFIATNRSAGRSKIEKYSR